MQNFTTQVIFLRLIKTLRSNQDQFASVLQNINNEKRTFHRIRYEVLALDPCHQSASFSFSNYCGSSSSSSKRRDAEMRLHSGGQWTISIDGWVGAWVGKRVALRTLELSLRLFTQSTIHRLSSNTTSTIDGLLHEISV